MIESSIFKSEIHILYICYMHPIVVLLTIHYCQCQGQCIYALGSGMKIYNAKLFGMLDAFIKIS